MNKTLYWKKLFLMNCYIVHISLELPCQVQELKKSVITVWSTTMVYQRYFLNSHSLVDIEYTTKVGKRIVNLLTSVSLSDGSNPISGDIPLQNKKVTT